MGQATGKTLFEKKSNKYPVIFKKRRVYIDWLYYIVRNNLFKQISM